MDGMLLAGRLLLAGVLAVAGAAKLADRVGTRRAVSDFGISGKLAAPLSILLPTAELIVAAALIPRFTARIAAVAAIVLLLTFLAAIVLNLAQGRKPDCRCFGRLRAAPIGASTVVLNLGLVAIAAWLVWHWDPGAGLLSWLAGRSALEGIVLIVGVAVLAVLALLTWQAGRTLRRQEQRIAALELRLEKIAGKSVGGEGEEGLPVGSVAPAFALDALRGGVVTLDQLVAAGKPVVLIFTELNCGPCEALLPDVARWQRDHAEAMTIAVVSEGTAAANQSKSANYGLDRVLLQQELEIADVYECAGAPGAVLVRTDGTIGSPVAGGAEQITRLVASIAGTAKSGKPQPANVRSLHILGRGGQGGR